MATTTTAFDTASPRMPSSRPIDCRWDRSRGIHFSNAKRPIPSDYTWPPTSGIVFNHTPTTTRSYGIRKIDKKPAVPSASQASGSSTDDAFKGTGVSFESTRREMAELRSMNSALEGENKTLKTDVDALAKSVEQLKATAERLMAQPKKDAQTIADLKKDREDLSEQLEARKTEYQKTLAASERKYEQTLAARERQYEQTLAARERNYEQQLNKIREESDPGRKENERVLEGIRKQEYNAALSLLKKEYAVLESKREDAFRKMKAKLECDYGQISQKTTEVGENLLERASKLRAEYQSLRLEFASRQERNKSDRANYNAYRDLYTNMRTDHFDSLQHIQFVCADLLAEKEGWQSAAKNFENAKALGLFHQLDKYSDLKKAISDYFSNQASHADETRSNLVALCDELHADSSALATPSHNSRDISLHMRFEEEPGLMEGACLAHHILYLNPLRKQIKAVGLHQRRLQMRADHATDGKAKRQAQHAMQQLRELFRLDIVFERSSRLAALEALLVDSPVEKAMSLRTLEHREKLTEVSANFHDRRQNLPHNEQQQAEHKRFQNIEQVAKRELEDLEMRLRKTALLEDELGILDESQLDSEIHAMIENCQLNLNQALEQLVSFKTSDLNSSKLRMASSSSFTTKKVSMRSNMRPSKPLLYSRKRSRAGLQANLDELVKKRQTLAPADHPAGLERQISKLTEKLEKMSESDGEWESDTSSGAPPSAEDDTNVAALRKRLSRRLRFAAPRERDLPKSNGSAERQEQAEASDLRLNLKPTASKQAHHTALPFDIDDLCNFRESSRISHHRVNDLAFGQSALELSTHLLAQDQQSTSGVQFGHVLQPHMHCASKQANSQPDAAGSSRASDSSYAPSNSSEDVGAYRLSELAQESSSSQEKMDQEQRETGVSHSNDQLAAMEPNDQSAEPQTDLTYQIPPAEYRAAVIASPNTNAAFWSYKMYKGSDGKYPNVFYCQKFDVAEARAKLFLGESVLGFDLEWEPYANSNSGIKQNISLIQIAAEDKIALFHVACFSGTTVAELLPPSLRKILESADVIKAGVNISGDIRRVKEYLGVEMKGVSELSHLYKLVRYSVNEPRKVNFGLVALATQVLDVLLLPLKKDDNRMSHWSRALNSQQSDYAACDAYAGFRLFHQLDNQRKAMKPTPPRPAFFETYQPIILGDGTEIVRGQRRTNVKRVGTTTVAEDADEEGEEFFDAVEELDPYELNSSDPSAIGIDEDSVQRPSAEIAYPLLPQVLESESNALGNGEESSQQAVNPTAPTSTSPLPAISQLSTSKPNSIKSSRPDTPEIRGAEAWATAFRSSRPVGYNLVARPSELRAYHLWHEQQLSVSQVAALLREPPLNLTTAASYVMQSIKEENLPFDAERLRCEVLIQIPKSVHGRYYKVLERAKNTEKA